jgi:hypothetical protein
LSHALFDLYRQHFIGSHGRGRSNAVERFHVHGRGPNAVEKVGESLEFARTPGLSAVAVTLVLAPIATFLRMPTIWRLLNPDFFM